MCPENYTHCSTYFLFLNKTKVDLSRATHLQRIFTHFATHFFQCWRGLQRNYAFFSPFVREREIQESKIKKKIANAIFA